MKKHIMQAAVLALFAGLAQAIESQKAVTSKTVTVYVEKQIPYTGKVVKYDPHGCP